MRTGKTQYLHFYRIVALSDRLTKAATLILKMLPQTGFPVAY
jgi:hypothetical protein